MLRYTLEDTREWSVLIIVQFIPTSGVNEGVGEGGAKERGRHLDGHRGKAPEARGRQRPRVLDWLPPAEALRREAALLELLRFLGHSPLPHGAEPLDCLKIRSSKTLWGKR